MKLKSLWLICAVAAAVTATGCGDGDKPGTASRAATPVGVSVYIGENGISISPKKAGAGTATFNIVNQSGSPQVITVESNTLNADKAGTKAETDTIKSGNTSEISILLSKGSYTVSSDDESISPATLTVGAARKNSNGQPLIP